MPERQREERKKKVAWQELGPLAKNGSQPLTVLQGGAGK